jgi:outer membrane protein W
MKTKLLLLTLTLCSLSLVSSAGDFYKKKKGKKGGGDAVEQGKILVDVYYGYKSPLSIAARLGMEEIKKENEEKFNGSGITPPDYTFSESGIFGARVEYLLTDHLGLGLAVLYEKITAGATVVNDNNLYAFSLENTRIGAIIGLNVHFLTQENLDPYLLVGVGYMNYKTDVIFSSPFGIPISDEEKEKYKIPTPLAARLALGARYFFTDNIGVKIELGAGGGGIVEAGLALKF